jgi:hypothetical protein
MIGFVPVFHFFARYQEGISRRSRSVTFDVVIVHVVGFDGHRSSLRNWV